VPFNLFRGFLCGVLARDMGWVRLLGRGVAWKDTTRHALLFSERYGHTRTLRVGRWSFKWLCKDLPLRA
jgi:hypothetical protein